MDDEDVEGCGSVIKLPPRNTTSNSKFVLAIEVKKSKILLVFFELPTWNEQQQQKRVNAKVDFKNVFTNKNNIPDDNEGV